MTPNNNETAQNSYMVNENTKVPFGRRPYRGKRIKDCPNSYLEWMVKHLWDGDLHEFAFVAKTILERRKNDPTPTIEMDLDKAADDFLRAHDIDPRQFR